MSKRNAPPKYEFVTAVGPGGEQILAVNNGRILRLKRGFTTSKPIESVQLAGARLEITDAGQIDKRITVTRLLLTGPFALAFPKKKDAREIFLLVEGADGGFVIPVNTKYPKYHRLAREAAMKINALAREASSVSS